MLLQNVEMLICRTTSQKERQSFDIVCEETSRGVCDGTLYTNVTDSNGRTDGRTDGRWPLAADAVTLHWEPELNCIYMLLTFAFCIFFVFTSPAKCGIMVGYSDISLSITAVTLCQTSHSSVLLLLGLHSLPPKQLHKIGTFKGRCDFDFF